MSTRYYRLTDDLARPNRWYLQSPMDGQGNALDPRLFMAGKPRDVAGPLRIARRRAGDPMSFTLADFDMPVVSAALGAEIERLAPNEVQRIPLRVDGNDDDFEILNVVRLVDALDHHRSKVTYWGPDDGRPDRIGMPKMVIDLAVDPERVGSAAIFRLENWRIALIVSDAVADVLASHSGVQLHPVSETSRSDEL